MSVHSAYNAGVAAMRATAMPVEATSPRAALIALDDHTQHTLKECFNWYGIEPVEIGWSDLERVASEPFHACVVQLNEIAGDIVCVARASHRNRRIVTYGVVTSPHDIVRFSDIGINAVFQQPLDRLNALKIVRDTKALIEQRIRRYARVPLVTRVQMRWFGGELVGMTREVGAGGLSLSGTAPLTRDDGVELAFVLPEIGRIETHARVCWTQSSTQQLAVRFDPSDTGGYAVKRWIENYLQIS